MTALVAPDTRSALFIVRCADCGTRRVFLGPIRAQAAADRHNDEHHPTPTAESHPHGTGEHP